MGFFSSRRSIDNDYVLQTAATTTGESSTGGTGDRGVVKVIRSRFYGKNKDKDKGKERVHGQPPPTSYKPHNLSAADALSAPQPASTPSRRSATYIPSAHNSPAVATGPSVTANPGPHRLRNANHHNEDSESSSRPSIPSKRSAKHLPRLDTLTALSTPASRNGTAPEASPLSAPASRRRGGKTPPTTPIRSAGADNITVTLAQRLNELATANTEGLLADDEYRLLRQNLFERFSTTASVPTESPIVPVAPPRPRVNGSQSDSRPSSVVRPLSVGLNRSPSITSKSSLTSGMSNLMRRKTKRSASTSNDISDSSSIVSNGSSNKKMFSFSRVLSKKSSNSSMKTAASRQADNASITSSRRTGTGPIADHVLHHGSAILGNASTVRSAAGSRKYQSPPSSFPMRAIGGDPRFSGSNPNLFDDDHLQTSQEIKEEIAAVEAEAKRLMDAFHGLELTTMTKLQRRQASALSPEEDESGVESTWTLVPPDGHSARKLPFHGDSDAASTRSGASAGTAPSMARSGYSVSARKVVIRSKSNLTTASLATGPGSKPNSLHRKNSLSSVTSQERKHMLNHAAAPPVPAIPAAYGHLVVHNNASNVSLTRSNGYLPMSAGQEDDKSSVGTSPLRRAEVGKQGAENEIEEIRRRREEVGGRYEERLEYLRAKLKGAQLHEKLMKK